MTTINLRVQPNSLEAKNLGGHVEDIVRTLIVGTEAPLPSLGFKSRKDTDEDIVRLTVDFMPEVKGDKNKGARGIMRGAHRGAF